MAELADIAWEKFLESKKSDPNWTWFFLGFIDKEEPFYEELKKRAGLL